ncbi:glutamate-5-semialdehyde dehydrogenase [Patescibacteria group bacterium]|nr:glutamate-5-semialdehyde dehydrogenase [Patescibacteria group bacterium]
MNELNEILGKVKESSRELVGLTDAERAEILGDFAGQLVADSAQIIAANALDLAKMDVNDPRYDRLLLNDERIFEIADGIKQIAGMKCPLDRIFDERKINGDMDLKKISVPLGVIGIIYEARPNVTCDVFAMCFKAGNACVLKGGSDADHSNRAIVGIIKGVLDKKGISDCAELLPNDREIVHQVFKAHEFIDVLIPRGSRKLIDFVRENAQIPVIETGAGVVHTYFDVDGDKTKGREIIFNAKTQRPSVCNALDTLLVHRDRVDDLIYLLEKLQTKNVVIYADDEVYKILSDNYPDKLLKKAQPDDFGREYLDFKLSVKVVSDVAEAMDHIAKYSSKHTEAIISENQRTIAEFVRKVDAGCVFSNCSTRFSDGGVFGLGAEVGISTQKLHARGPMGIDVLTTYKWVLRGDGEVRE